MGTITIDPAAEKTRMAQRFETEVLPELARAIGTQDDGVTPFPISAEARDWWMAHYTRTFFFAEHAIAQATWATDRPDVLKRAVLLGRLARLLADAADHSQIELRDAKVSSMEADCGIWLASKKGLIVPFYKWC